jgi:glutathione S-transferase
MYEQQLLVGWFCPWAQRAWIAVNLLESIAGTVGSGAGTEGGACRPCVEVVNDSRSVVLNTDLETEDGDGIARLMVKGPLLGSLSVPALLTDQGPISGDSIRICQLLWESNSATASCFIMDANCAEESQAWSGRLSKPFYNALMNRPLQEGHKTELSVDSELDASKYSCNLHFEELLDALSEFGLSIEGDYCKGESISLIDVTIWPFLQRIFGLQLFQVYRSDYLSLATLSEITYPPCPIVYPNSSAVVESRRKGIQYAMQWYERCLALDSFARTLPADTVAWGFSPSLRDIYKIYALGVGLKTVNFCS